MTGKESELRTLINCLLAMAASDGVLHEKEVDVILEILGKVVGIGVKRKTIYKAYEDFKFFEENSAYKILESSKAEIGDEMKEFIIKASYLIMISDGQIVDHETGKLSEIAALLNIEEGKFARLIKEAAQKS